MGIDKAKAISDPGINIELASHLRNAGGFEIKPIEIDRFHRDKNYSFSQFRLFDFFGRKFASLRAEILMWPDYIWQRSFFSNRRTDTVHQFFLVQQRWDRHALL